MLKMADGQSVWSGMELIRKNVNRGLLATLIVGPVMALGAVHADVLAAFMLVGAVFLIYTMVQTRREGFELDLPGVFFLGLLAITVVQIIPLPAPLVELISPYAYEVRSRALLPLGGDVPAFMPLSLDVSFTVVEIGKLILYTVVYWMCLGWTKKWGSKFILNLVIFAGVAAAGVLITHKILMLSKIYAFYTPVHLAFNKDVVSAPLINANHMSAFLGLSTAVAIGRALAIRDRSKRILMVVLAGLMGASLVLTLSRGGIAAFVAGQLLFIVLRVSLKSRKKSQSRTESASPRMTAWLPVGLVISLGLALFVAQDAIIGEFASGDAKKLDLIWEGLPLVGHFVGTGVGRGAFWVGLPLVSDIGAGITYTHAENAVVQILAEYGVLFGTAALLVPLFIVGRFLRSPPSGTERVAGVVAIVAFGLHNLVDFNMEIPGVAVVVVALLAVLVGGQHRRSKKSDGAAVTVSRPVVIAGAVLIIVVSGVMVYHFARKTVGEEERELRQALADGETAAFSDKNIGAVLKRHPSSWYFPFIVGVNAFHKGEENPLPWFARAIELNNGSASAHFYAGRTFLRAGKLDQALLEFRTAARLQHAFAAAAAKDLVSVVPQFDGLSAIAVKKSDRLLLWGALAQVFSMRGLDLEAEKVDLALLKEDPLNAKSLARHASRLARRGETTAAIELASRLKNTPDFGPAGAKLLAWILQESGDLKQAVAVLEEQNELSPRRRDILTALAHVQQKAGDTDRALRTAQAVRAISQGMKSQAQAFELEANINQQAGRFTVALALLRQAHAMDPSNVATLRKIVRLAESTDDKTRLLEALSKLNAMNPHDQETAQRLKELRKRDKM